MAPSRIIKSPAGSFRPVNWNDTPAPVLPTRSDNGSYAHDHPTAREALEQAVAEAHTRGFKEGQDAALVEYKRSLSELSNTLASGIADLASVRATICRAAQLDILRLTIAIARRVIHREVALAPDILQSICGAVLEQLDRQEIYRVRIHPKMAAGVQEELTRLSPARPIQVFADPSISEGGCVFETSRGNVDAGIESQLGEIENGLTDRLRTARDRA